MIKEYLPAVLNGAAGIFVILISFLVDLRVPISIILAKVIGMVLVYLGMALVVWAAIHIKGSILGMVKPGSAKLVQAGPYRTIRHPIYFGMTVALIGVAFSLRSWIGFLAVLILFLPSEILRAKLEEKELAKVFKEEWNKYIKRTGFFNPIRKKD